jgi:signal transduction histidine kinase
MEGRAGRALAALAAFAWVVSVAGYVYTVVVHARLADLGRGDLATDGSEAVVYGAALFSAATVGLVVAVRQRRHPVGWLFLALGVALSVGGAGDAHALDRGVVHGDTSAMTGLALVAGQASFIAWFGLLAFIVHLTPTGRPLSPRWGRAMKVTGAAAVAAFIAKAVQDTAFDPPYEGLRNPWAVRSIAGLVDAVAGVGIALTMVGLVAAAVSLVVRFRRAEGPHRQQLRWMAVIAVPLPALVMTSFVASQNDLPEVRTIATGGYVALLPIAAGLSVQRYRLYDVERILSRATGYVLSSVVLASLYGAVVATVGRTVGRVVDDSVLPAVVATVATVSAAAPLHRWLQDVIDRRFDRRRYDAHRLVRDHVRASVPARSIEATLADALGDPTVTVAYWIAAHRQWVSAGGQPATIDTGDIEVSRDDEPVARIRADPTVVDSRLAHELAAEALPELDNVRLRAEVALQLEEVRDSRARIVAAQAVERHRIERNLHDGAQQRLLALAMQLRAAQLQHHPAEDEGETERTVFDRAVAELGTAVRELRDLANGLRPAELADGGLVTALDDLAGRIPLAVELDLSATRFEPAIEEALWFVACEAAANAVKHAAAGALRISLSHDGASVRLVCADDGAGGADPDGSGLRGIADRVEAVGGSLRVDSSAGCGSTIEAVLPCVS